MTRPWLMRWARWLRGTIRSSRHRTIRWTRIFFDFLPFYGLSMDFRPRSVHILRRFILRFHRPFTCTLFRYVSIHYISFILASIFYIIV